MKKNIYRFLKLHYWSRKVLLSKFARIFYSEKDVRKKIFKSIYESYHWRDYKKPEDNESISGRGSDIIKTERFVKEFNIFLKKNKITKILDLGCGDFLWMKNTIIGLPDLISYHGIDIVESLIDKNKKKFSNEIIKFSCKDFFEEKIEGEYEIIIIRDVFIHLYNKNIIKFLEKIKLTNAKYIAITSTSSIFVILLLSSVKSD